FGPFFPQKVASRYGVTPPNSHQLRQQLLAASITTNDINLIILSHLHFDHVGGLFYPYPTWQQQRDPSMFQKAKYLMSVKGVQRALNPHLRDKASFVDPLRQWLTTSLTQNNIHQIPSDNYDLPGAVSQCFNSGLNLQDKFEFIHSDGHTPGQLHTLFSLDPQGNNKVFFCGDLIPGTAWLQLPITCGYDRFPEKIIEEKKQILERAAQEGWYLLYYHDPECIMSQVKQSSDHKFQAINQVARGSQDGTKLFTT
ncbi:MAG: MBL fold metallo-hydrolase, partial [Proteobacteria bacterium]|nr:MBL fold metallo-hydrolase [Pseudomonadota bacterium]